MPQVSKVSELNQVYTDILTSLNYQVEEDGEIGIKIPTGSTAPAKVEGKQLVLATQKRMAAGFGEDFQPFHPLCESMARQGTSVVQQHMQRTMKTNIVYTLSLMANALMRISIKTELHKDLPPEMLDVLMKLSDAKEETHTALDKIIAAANKKNRICTVFLRGATTLAGKKVNRACIVRFPILEELDSDSPDVFGVKVAKKHRKTISALFRILVPNGDNLEEYSAGTISRVAPYFTSMCEAWQKIGGQLNRCIYRFSEPLQLGLSPFNLFDPKVIETFPKIYNSIPSLSGNEGGKDVVPDDAPPAENKAVAQAAQAMNLQATGVLPPMPTVQQPTRQPAPQQAAPSNGNMSMAEFNARMNPQPQQPVYHAPPPQYGQYGQQPMYGQYQQQPMYGQPPVQNGPAQVPWLAAQNQANAYQQQVQQNGFAQLLPQRQPMYGQQQPQYGGQPQYSYNTGGGL